MHVNVPPTASAGDRALTFLWFCLVAAVAVPVVIWVALALLAGWIHHLLIESDRACREDGDWHAWAVLLIVLALHGCTDAVECQQHPAFYLRGTAADCQATGQEVAHPKP
jgi:hypothetical protein